MPLSAIGAANVTNFTGFAIQDAAGSSEPTFYLDEIQFIGAAGPALTHLTVNAGQPIRTADARWFGINTPNWDSVLDTPQTMGLMANMGIQAMRFPGGSESDDYHWLYNRTGQQHLDVGHESGQFYSCHHQHERAGDDHGELWHGLHQ